MDNLGKYELDDVAETKVPDTLMAQVKEQVNYMRGLKDRMDAAEANYKAAKDAYDLFAQKTLPDLFKLNGLSAVADDDGHIYAVETVTHCAINKSDADKKNVIQWLRDHDAGSLVQSECIVPVSQVDKLQANNITYEENTSVNTNSVKSFLLGALGQKESPATISVDDLPKGLNFFQFDQVVVK